MKSLLFCFTKRLAEALCLSSVLVMTCLADPPRYRVTNLGSLSTGASRAYSVNDAGQVVGEAIAPGGEESHAFLYSEGTMQDLGTLARGNSVAHDINDSGLVTGASDTADSRTAFLYVDGVLQDIGTPSGIRFSTGDAINDHGQVTGELRIGSSQHAFIYTEGTMQAIELPPEAEDCSEFRFAGNGINNSAQITGVSYREVSGSCRERAFLYSHESGEMVLIGDLLPGYGTHGVDINDSGQVLVRAIGNGDSGSFLYSDGAMTRIGGTGFDGLGINNAGWIVGDMPLGGSNSRAVLYMEGQVYDLNDLVTDMSGWDELRTAHEISDSGFIAGVGRTASGRTRAFLLTPLDVKVKLDVRPHHAFNRINLSSNGIIAVAILTTGTFDATQVNWETVRLGRKKAQEHHQRLHVKDVDRDGDMDAVLHFRIRKIGIRCHDTKVALTGKTFSGVTFRGTDRVRPVNCRK